MDRRRAVLFFILLFVPLGGLEARLIWLQLLYADEYAGPPRRRSLEIASAPRGRILDRQGRVLARDERSFDLYLVLEDFEKAPEARDALRIPDLDGRIEEIYRKIEALMSRRPERERGLIFARERRTPHLVFKGLSFEQAVEIETHLDRYRGCIVREALRRVYPYGHVASAVVGTLGRPRPEEADELLESAEFEQACDEETLERFKQRRAFDEELVGRMGIEAALQKRLRGKPALLIQERDPVTGEHLRIDLVPGRPGEDVELTIDAEFQHAVEDILAGVPTRSTAVVMDPATGEIRALASNVSYDPNHFIPPTNAGTIKGYMADVERSPLRTHATQSPFQLGSIFKILTSIAALEEKHATPDRIIECKGWFLGPNVTHTRCSIYVRHGASHGPLTVKGALEQSCNCYFYQVGQELGMEALARWAQRMGFGVKSGIEIAENAGTLPGLEAGRRWRNADAHFLAIGQHELTATPVQVARFLSAVANGGTLVRPHLVRGNRLRGAIAFTPGTLAAVRAGLHSVTHGEHGTARESGLARFGVVGKTSTAQASGGKPSHAWFGGFNEAWVVVVLVEHGGGGGATAAPIAAKIFEKLQP